MKPLLRRRCWVCRFRLLTTLLLLLSAWMAYRLRADDARPVEGTSPPAVLARSP